MTYSAAALSCGMKCCHSRLLYESSVSSFFHFRNVGMGSSGACSGSHVARRAESSGLTMLPAIVPRLNTSYSVGYDS